MTMINTKITATQLFSGILNPRGDFSCYYCGVYDQSIIGAIRSYGACKPPYWHNSNYMEVLEPC